ncbi:proactivator polypeptide, partial [Plakobranchus ocellatus]
MKLVSALSLLCLVLGFGQGASVYKSGLRRELCNWGAQYWCSSPKTAGLCSKTEWCKENHWNRKVIQDTSCSVGHELIKHARFILSSLDEPPESDYETASLIAKSCSSMKDQDNRLLCKDIVTSHKHLPKLVELVASKLPVQAVTEAVGVCKREAPKQETETVSCITCEDIVTLTQKHAYRHFSFDVFRTMFKSHCAKFGQNNKVCQDLAVANYKEFHKMLIQMKPSSVCKAQKQCISQAGRLSPINPSDEICDTCKTVIDDIRSMDRDKNVQDAIRSLLNQTCKYMGQFKELCGVMIDEGLQYVFEIIASEMEPEVVCEKLHLCPGEGQKTMEKISADEANWGIECALCEFVMREVDKMLLSNKTEEAILKILDEVCTRLPPSISQQCEELLNKYKADILKILTKELDPKSVCTMLNICKNGKLEAPKEKVTPDDKECVICEFVIKVLDDILMANETEETLAKLLDSICERLPGDLNAECERFVGIYSPQIIALIVSKMRADQICATLGLCPKDSRVDLKVQPKDDVSESNDELCDLCKYLVNYIDTYLQENKTKEQIEKLLEQFCDVMPAELSEMCDIFVKQYGPMLVELLVEGLDPKKACAAVDLCLDQLVRTKDVKNDKKTEICILCETVLQEVEDLLAQNVTRNEIVAALQKICNLFSGSIKDECSQAMAMYTDYVIDLIEKELPPELICQYLGICGNQTTPVLKVNTEETCDICEMVVKKLDSLIGNNNTVAGAERGLKLVCNLLPKSVEKKCKSFVDIYTPFILQLVAAEIRPTEFCTFFGLCSKSKTGKPDVEDVETSKLNGGELCFVCKMVVSALDELLDSNATKADVEAALERVCSMLPQGLKPQCDAFVSEYASYVVDIIVSDLKPDMVCEKINLCTGGKINLKDTQALMKKARPRNGEVCTACVLVFETLENILPQNATKEAIADALDRVCDLIPDNIKGQCKSMVRIYLPYVIDLIVMKFPPNKICLDIGLCTNSSSAARIVEAITAKLKLAALKKNTQGEPGPVCIECEQLLAELQKDLEEPGFEQKVEETLGSLCATLPTTLADTCKELVKETLPEVIQLLLKYTPDQICEMFGLCQSSIQAKGKSLALSEGPQCILCEFVMTKLDSILVENATQQKIEQALEQVCNLLPASIKTDCDILVLQYTPQLTLLLLQVKPAEVCAYLGLCSKAVEKMSSPEKAGPFCVICEFVMTQLDNILAGNATQQQIEKALDQVCNLLPASVKQECDSFVAQYTPTLIQLLLQVKPAQVCTYLALCSSKKTGMKVQASPRAGVECLLCKFVMNQLETMLANNATQKEIEQALEQVCDALPADIKKDCDKFIEEYIPEVVQLLLSYKPEEICAMLALCNASASAPNPENFAPTCELCELIMEYLDRILPVNATEKQIEKALDEVCSLLPGSFKAECDSFVAEYAPEIVRLLLKVIPSELCKILGICSSKLTAPNPENFAPTCELCELIMGYLDRILPVNATEKQIEKALDEVCGLLPSTYATECNRFVAEYASEIVRLLLKVLPSEVCKIIGICSSKFTAVPEPVGKSAMCVVCDAIVKEFESLVGTNATKQQIEAFLDKPCTLVPTNLKEQCDTIVATFTPEVLDLLLKITPDQWCAALKVCKARPAPVTQILKDGPQCTICEFAMTQLDNILAENATKAQIEAALDQVCNLLPASVKQECDNLVAQYTPQLIQLLLQYKPQQVCTLLGLCTSTTKMRAAASVKAGPQCTLCEFVMAQLDNILAENSTEAQIEAVLDKICNLLPASIKQECDTFVAQYSPQLIQLLLQYKPQQVCTLLGLCTSTTKTQAGASVKAGPQCILCEFVMTQLDNILAENSTEAQIEAALDKICNLLPASIKQECDTFVAQYSPQLIQLLLQYKPQQVCTLLGLCTSTTKTQAAASVKAGPQCILCEFVMNQLDNILAENSTEAQIEAALDKICNLLPASIKQECDTFVAQYSAQLIQLLLQYKPQQVCTLLGLCTSGTKTRVVVTLKAGPQCTICEFAMTQLDNILAENSTKAQIEAALDQVCNLLPASVKQDCDNLVAQYTPQLIQLLLQYKPQQVCTLLGLCTSSLKTPTSVKAGPQCILCEFVMTQLDNILAENSTEAQIEAALDKICNLLPASIKQECDNFVAQYSPQLIQLLLQYKPQQVCTLLGLCTSGTKTRVVATLKAGPQCTICEFAMTQLDNILAENSTKAQIEAALDQVCNLLPASVKQDCDNLVAQYTPQLIQLLLQHKPQQVCTLLGLCTSSLKTPASVKAGPQCILCEFVMTQLDNILAENSTEAQIKAALDKVCNLLPASIKQECDNFVAQYSAQLIQLLLQYKPQQVCTLLGLCTSTSKIS